MGSIGRAAARIAKTFDMRVIGVSRTPRTDAHADRAVGVEQLSAVLPEADALLISVPLTPSTRHLVGAGESARLKPSAVLINVARGEVVDEAALVRALADGGSRVPASTCSPKSRCRRTTRSGASAT